MNLPSGGALVLRRRTGWEAADSGLLLWRGSCGYILLFLGVPLLGLALGMRVAGSSGRPFLYAALWWLKPLFDRFVLHVVSVRFFEPRSSPLRLLKGIGRSLIRGLAGDLLWRRFGLRRSACMPIRVLENLKGKNARQRKAALKNGGLDFCCLLTIFCFILECILLLGEAGFTFVMVEFFRPGEFVSFEEFLVFFEPYMFAGSCFNLGLVESLYVCMGFGLYINSRVEVEGWDIQLLFQNFTERRQRKPAARNAASPGGPGFFPAALVVCVLMAALVSPGVSAQEQEAPPSGGIPLEVLNGILESPDFGRSRDGWGIRLKGSRDRAENSLAGVSPGMGTIKESLGKGLRFLLAAGITGLAVFSLARLYKLRREKNALLTKNRNFSVIPGSQAESPESLLEKALSLYKQGHIRAAWAACLSGAIAAYSGRRGLSFPRDATEYGCLALVRAAGEDSAAGFAGLVQNWITFAYAGRSPREGAFEQTLDFCWSLLNARPPAAERESRA